MRRIAGSPEAIATRLRREVREQVGLPITVGVARTKFLAKVASGVAKPDGLLVVPPGGELEFLHPLPVERLWGVGKVTAAKLHAPRHHDGRRGRADDRGPADPDASAGRRAGSCTRSSHNRDPRRVQTRRRRRSMGSQRAMGRGAAPHGRHRREPDRARRPCHRAACARADRVGRTVILRLRFADFARATRSRTLPTPTADTAPLLAAARGLLAEAEPLDRRARA